MLNPTAEELLDFLRACQVHVLNVVGNRASVDPDVEAMLKPYKSRASAWVMV